MPFRMIKHYFNSLLEMTFIFIDRLAKVIHNSQFKSEFLQIIVGAFAVIVSAIIAARCVKKSKDSKIKIFQSNEHDIVWTSNYYILLTKLHADRDIIIICLIINNMLIYQTIPFLKMKVYIRYKI